MSLDAVVYFTLSTIYACVWTISDKAKKQPEVLQGRYGKKLFWLFVLYALVIVSSCFAFCPQVTAKIFTGDYDMVLFKAFRYIVPATLLAGVCLVYFRTHSEQIRSRTKSH